MNKKFEYIQSITNQQIKELENESLLKNQETEKSTSAKKRIKTSASLNILIKNFLQQHQHKIET
jgi:hypothetical protein